MPILKRNDLLYPELSYEIIGAAFDVYNLLGEGHHEKYYQKALAEALTNKELKFKQQLSCSLNYRGKILGKRFLDFLVENKIIIEIKKGNKFSKQHIDQVLDYLKLNN
ncbi:MAG: GxxExxY protein, partial [bacterium]|nr:GxxExxY protein [bacterium]